MSIRNTAAIPVLAAAILVLTPSGAAAQVFHRRTEQAPNPVEWVITPSGISEQIIRHEGFTVSYNSNLLIPNWVCWELTPKEAAADKVSREGFEFTPDPEVKGDTARDSDYRGSSYDRGHMAPAADMKWSETAMRESFYLSNVCPQDRQLNAGLWLELEQKCRWWAKKYKSSVYISCGPMFVRDEAAYIGEDEVVVPDAFFKVVAQKRGDGWVAAAFIFPNCPLDNRLEDLAKPVTVLELINGYQFLRTAPVANLKGLLDSWNKDDWVVPGWKN